MEHPDEQQRVDRGWIDVWTGEDGLLRVTWLPDRGQPDYPGHTYKPSDANLPADFPTAGDRTELMAWARRRWDNDTLQ